MILILSLCMLAYTLLSDHITHLLMWAQHKLAYGDISEILCHNQCCSLHASLLDASLVKTLQQLLMFSCKHCLFILYLLLFFNTSLIEISLASSIMGKGARNGIMFVRVTNNNTVYTLSYAQCWQSVQLQFSSLYMAVS